jgi:ribosomal protein S18 acetylase RimI-like enzyme
MDLASIAPLAGALVRMHHAVDPERFFLPERVEEGYAWWLGRELARDGAVVLVAAEGERVTGYAYGTREERDWNMLLDEHGTIHDVFVAAEARGSGAGQKLVRAMVEALHALGARTIVLSTMVSNETAQRLFAACGFRATMIEMTHSGIATAVRPDGGAGVPG